MARSLLDEGYAFTVGDLWQTSIFSVDATPDDNLFRPVDLTFSTLNLEDTIASKTFEIEFSLPVLGDVNELSLKQVEDPEAPISSASSDHYHTTEPDEDQDVWQLDLSSDKLIQEKQLYTWEAFERKEEDGTRTAYISEAGPKAFDAALQKYQVEDTSESTDGAFPIDVVLKSLSFLGLGRSSILFQWDAEKKTFVRTLDNATISGHSRAVSISLVDTFIAGGTMFKNLAAYSDSLASGTDYPARIALKRSIAEVLSAIDQQVSDRSPNASTLLHLQEVFDRPLQLLHQLRLIVNETDSASNNAILIEQVYKHVQRHVEDSGPFSGILRIIFARTVAPWLVMVCADVGLHDQTTPGTREASGIDVAPETVLDASLGAPSFTPTNIASFVSPENAILIAETAKSLDLLGAHVSEHPLLQPSAWETRSINVHDYATATIDTITNRAKQYECDLLSAIKRFQSPSKAVATGNMHKPQRKASIINTENLAWAGDEVQHEFLEEMNANFDELPGTQIYELPMELQSLVHSAIDSIPDDNASGGFNFLSDVLVNPIEMLRPAIHTQSRLVNATVLRYLFRTANIRQHLDLQHAFHLFGNTQFLVRLSAALFSADLQTAERKRGNVPTAQTMGLRLDARDGQRWPPASSELRLTMMGILVETYTTGREHSLLPLGKRETRELPGGLSFSIRELSDADINRVLDPASIYALDFLRLQYSAPAPLDAILNLAAMGRYDEVFRVMLRMLRMLHLTTHLRAECSAKLGHNIAEKDGFFKSRFAGEAYHIISVLMSHFMDLGIAGPWREMTRALEDIEVRMQAEDKAGSPGSDVSIGIDGLRHLHEEFLEAVRGRLFLRSRHERLRAAIEDLFTAIVTMTKVLQAKDDTKIQEGYNIFRITVVSFLEILRASVERTPKAITATGRGALDEGEAMKILAMRLDRDGFYGVSTKTAMNTT